MMMKKLFFSGALAALLFSGCASFNAAKNVENARQLRVGMSKARVLEIMGEPVKEKFSRPDLWFYYREANWIDGFVTEDECFPLVFKNGRLQGWGNAFYTRYRQTNKAMAQGAEAIEKQ